MPNENFLKTTLYLAGSFGKTHVQSSQSSEFEERFSSPYSNKARYTAQGAPGTCLKITGDRRTDTPSYRDTTAHLKRSGPENRAVTTITTTTTTLG